MRICTRELGGHGVDLGALLVPGQCITNGVAVEDILGVLNREGCLDWGASFSDAAE